MITMKKLATSIAVALGTHAAYAGAITPMVVNTGESIEYHVAVYVSDPKYIFLTPLVQGGVPNLKEGGTQLISESPCAQDMTAPPEVQALQGDLGILAIWRDLATGKTCYSRFTKEKVAFQEASFTDWGGGDLSLKTLPPKDLNGDKRDDLVLLKEVQNENGTKTLSYKVTLGQDNGAFDFAGPLHVLADQVESAHVTLADAGADGQADIVFHSFSNSGSKSTKVYELSGKGDGTFTALAGKKLLFESTDWQGSGAPLVADFNNDKLPDIFLPPDHQVWDKGQGYLALGTAKGTFAAPKESVDFDPSETPSTPPLSVEASSYDVNRDGYQDLVVKRKLWENYNFMDVYFGKGDGTFNPQGKNLFKAPSGSNFPSLTFLDATKIYPAPPSVPDTSLADCAGAEHAVFNVDTQTMHIPNVQAQVFTDPNGKLTGQIAELWADMKLLTGVEDFEFSNAGPFTIAEKLAPEGYNNCYARYIYIDEANGWSSDAGYVSIPFLDVPTKIMVPGGRFVIGPTNVYSVLLRRLAKAPTIFHLVQYKHLDTIYQQQGVSK